MAAPKKNFWGLSKRERALKGAQREITRSMKKGKRKLASKRDMAAGRREYARRMENPAESGAQYRLAEAVAHGRARTKTRMSKKAAREIIAKTPKKKRSQFMKGNKGHKRRNPESTAIQAYVLTHGKQPGTTTEVETQIRYHSVLAGMGKLERITFAGGPVKWIDFGKGTELAMNEKRTQLFIVGGDQSVNLRDFGISPVHETEILGEVRSVIYFTEKKHLIEKDGGKGRYEHKFGSPRPVLVYDVRNKLLAFAGGGYTIPAEGIDG